MSIFTTLGRTWAGENMLNPLLQSPSAFIPIARPKGSRQVKSLAIILDFRLQILDMWNRYALSICNQTIP
jgi:hypothetical protein